MSKTAHGIALFLFVVIASSFSDSANAQPPSQGSANDSLWGTPIPVEYRTLPRPIKPHSHKYEPATPAPIVVSKPIQPYAYGWFGASTHQHWSRHFGTRSAFTQWTLK